jgi:diguanylate cyclase (GGDEF)-like protein/putative nucleotidyltransferase with HDIG domain
MDPPLRERLGVWTSIDAGTTVPRSRAAMARAGFWFGVAGALIGLIALVSPTGADTDPLALTLAIAISLGIAVVAMIGFDRLPIWMFHAGVVASTAAATLAIHGWGDQAPYGPLPYLWVTLYAFYFFSLPAALIHIAIVGVMFGIELGTSDIGYTPVSEWVATIASLATAGLVIAAIRDRLSALISNLTDAARSDPLTELLNRRGFEETFEVELERARRTDGSLSVIVGDLDRFERVNTQLGRGGGDETLRRIGDTIVASKRSWDSAARVGGEEFAVLAPETDEHGAYVLAERLRLEIERVLEPGVAGELTASFGIASFPVHGQTAAALLKAADQALAAAKRLGSNRSVISSAEVPGILARAARNHEDGQVDLAALLDLAEALDLRDSGSASHSQRVGRYSELIARELGLPPEAVERLRIAGILHDIGRVGTPDDVLSKAGPLTESEWDWVRSHPRTGARMLETTSFGEIGGWILAHHERPDGQGYPDGRAGDDVPLEASIIGVADAYEAMTADRPYRPSMDPAAASQELRDGAGRQFDERVVEALLRAV